MRLVSTLLVLALSAAPRAWADKRLDDAVRKADAQLARGKPAEAVRYLEKAQAAAPRPNRALADKGRQREIATKLQLARSKL